MKNEILAKLIKKFSEKSTLVGLTGLLSLLGIHYNHDIVTTSHQVIVGLFSLVAILFKENGEVKK